MTTPLISIIRRACLGARPWPPQDLARTRTNELDGEFGLIRIEVLVIVSPQRQSAPPPSLPLVRGRRWKDHCTFYRERAAEPIVGSATSSHSSQDPVSSELMRRDPILLRSLKGTTDRQYMLMNRRRYRRRGAAQRPSSPTPCHVAPFSLVTCFDEGSRWGIPTSCWAESELHLFDRPAAARDVCAPAKWQPGSTHWGGGTR